MTRATSSGWSTEPRGYSASCSAHTSLPRDAAFVGLPLDVGVGHGGLDPAGQDGVARAAERADVVGDRSHQPEHAVLRRAVWRHRRRPDLAGGRAHDHDPAPAGLAHLARRTPWKAGTARPGSRPCSCANPRRTAPRSVGRGRRLGRRCSPGSTPRPRRSLVRATIRSHSRGVLQRGGDGLDAGLVGERRAVVPRSRPVAMTRAPRCGQQRRRGPTDPRAGAGHQRDASFQVVHACSLPFTTASPTPGTKIVFSSRNSDRPSNASSRSSNEHRAETSSSSGSDPDAMISAASS